MIEKKPGHAELGEKRLRRSLRNAPGTENPTPEDKDTKNENGDNEYGFLDYRNISRIRLGKYEFDTWYGNSALFKEPSFNKFDNKFHTSLAFKNEITSNENVIAKTTSAGKLLKKLSNSKSLAEITFDEKEKKPWLDVLYVCPYCFKFTDVQIELEQHINCCQFKTKLPGKVMYNDGELLIRKVKGVNHKLFCQCMCLMAKFFLDNKSIFYHLDYFDFYVAYQLLDRHEVPMGFYSRELLSWEMNNLSCICVLPCYQKRHLGTKLIDFSYNLSEYEQQISGPEHPLSPLGKMTYLKYWCQTIALSFVYGVLSTKERVTLQMISETTNLRIEDILLSLSFLDVIYDNKKKNVNMDYYQDRFKYNDHFVFLEDGNYKVCIDKIKLKQWIVTNKIPNRTILNKKCFVLY
jgi:histone acetyltransferase SAS2